MAISIKVGADFTNFKRELNAGVGLARKSGKDITQSLGGITVGRGAGQELAQLVKHMKGLDMAGRALKTNFDKTDGQLREIAQAAGISGDKFAEMGKKMLQNRAAQELEKQLKSLQRSTGATESEMAKLRGELSLTDNRLKQLGQSAQASGDNLKSLATQAAGTVVAVVGLFKSASAFTGMSSIMIDLESRVKLVSGGLTDTATIMERLGNIANTAYSPLEKTAEAFLSNATTLNALGFSMEKQLDMADAMTNALVVSGAKGEQFEMVMNAVSRAMAVGKLKGEELNTILKRGGTIAEGLADSLGVNVTALKTLGAQGKLTSTVVANSLIANMEKWRQQAESMPATINDSFIRLGNHLKSTVREFDKATGATDQFVGALRLAEKPMKMLSDNADALGQIAKVAGALLSGRLVAAVTSYGVAAVKTATQVNLLTAAQTGLARASAFMGGPLGVAITATATATLLFATRTSEADKIAKKYGFTLDEVTKRYKDLSAEATKSGVAVQNASARMLADRRAEQENQIKSLKAQAMRLRAEMAITTEGMSVTMPTPAFVKGGSSNPALEASRAAYKELSESLRSVTAEYQAGKITLEEYGISLTTINSKLETNRELGQAGWNTQGVEKLGKALETLITQVGNLDELEGSIKSVTREVDALASTASGRIITSLHDIATAQDLINKNKIQVPTTYLEAAEYLAKAAEETKGFEEAQKALKESALQASQAIYLQQAAVATLNGDFEEAIRLGAQFAELMGNIESGPKEKPTTKRGGGRRGGGGANELNSLLNTLDPLRAASEEFAKGQTLLNSAMQAGSMAAADYTKYMDALNQRYADAAKAADKSADQIRLANEFQKEYLETVGRTIEAEQLAARMRIQKWQDDADGIVDATEKQEALAKVAEMAGKALEKANRDPWAGAKAGLDAYYNEATNKYTQLQNFAANSMKGLEDSMVNAFMTGKLNFSSMVNSMIADLARLVIRSQVTGQIANFISGQIGTFFTPNAHGNIYPANTGLDDYKNQIVSQPTIFAFAKGAGLMGEAGAEAIMPLTRTSQGDLGVKAQMGDIVPEINIKVVNMAGANVQPEVKTQPNAQGGVDMEMVLRQVDQGLHSLRAKGQSRLAGGLESEWGLSSNQAMNIYRRG